MPASVPIPTAAMTRRRSILTCAALAGAAGVLGAGLAPAARAAATKVAQKTVAYRSTPNGKARCDLCTQWQAPASCKVVEGTISPSGWCSLYAAKA